MAGGPVGEGGAGAPTSRVVLVTAVAVLSLVAVLVVGSWWWAGRAQPVPWDTVEVRGLEVVVEYRGRACESHSRLEVEVTEEELVLTVHAGGRGIACDDEGVARRVSAALEEPLGSRSIVDGACRRADLANDLACEGK